MAGLMVAEKEDLMAVKMVRWKVVRLASSKVRKMADTMVGAMVEL